MSRAQKITLLVALYFAQGLPFGFFTIVLPATLRQAGLPLTTISLVSVLLTLPWLLKFLWAPFVDRSRVPLLTALVGHRRSEDVDGIVEEHPAAREVGAREGEFLLDVSSTDPPDRPATGQHIQRRHRLRGLERMAQRRDVDVREQPDGARHAGDKADEEIRDAVLATAGQLSPQMFGTPAEVALPNHLRLVRLAGGRIDRSGTG